MNTPHPQAELLRAIADGKPMQKPEWQDDWSDISSETALYRISQGMCVRIKPTTITVNGVEVPEPMRVAPKVNTGYFVPDVLQESMYRGATWTNHTVDERRLQHGLCHTSEANAVAHAKAMLAPSMNGGE